MLAQTPLSILIRSLRPSAHLKLSPFLRTSLPLRTFASTPKSSSITARPYPPSPLHQTRRNSSLSPTSPTITTTASSSDPTPQEPPAPSYEITLTCKPCSHRSTHKISKQGYHSGTVLITCPECKNRHVISDHLKFFNDRSFTIEDLMRQKGQLVKKGSLGEGDVEFWDDGSTSERGGAPS